MMKFFQNLFRRRSMEVVNVDTFPWDRPDEPGRMTDAQTAHFYEEGKCPYCGSRLVRGPAGGMNVNLFCEDEVGCNSRFNVADMGTGLEWAEFTGRARAT